MQHNLHASILCSVHVKNSKLFRFTGGKLYLHWAELADRLFLEGSLVILPLKEAIVSSVMATAAPGFDVKTSVLPQRCAGKFWLFQLPAVPGLIISAVPLRSGPKDRLHQATSVWHYHSFVQHVVRVHQLTATSIPRETEHAAYWKTILNRTHWEGMRFGGRALHYMTVP